MFPAKNVPPTVIASERNADDAVPQGGILESHLITNAYTESRDNQTSCHSPIQSGNPGQTRNDLNDIDGNNDNNGILFRSFGFW
jgi:hypothetical protein